MESWMKSVPGSERWTDAREIAYGWSGERKYRICQSDGPELLLRAADAENYAKMRAIHEAMQPVNELGIRCSKALDCGLSDGHAWALLTYMEGTDAESGIRKLSEAEQYRLGYESGETLRKIHSLPVPEGKPAWDVFFNAKIDRKRRRFIESGIKVEGIDTAIAYIDANRHLLKNRPQSLQHGDSHIGNMVLTPDGHIAAIDFNRLDYGDPWEEFNRIIWDVRASEIFTCGRVDGYFGAEEVPELFWRLLALYVANDQVSALPWAVDFGLEEEQIAMENFCAVREWFDDFTIVVPHWYERGAAYRGYL